MCEDILYNALIPSAYTDIPEGLFKRPTAYITLSIWFFLFATKQNVHWNVQDWNKNVAGKVSKTVQVILLSTAMTRKRDINIFVICFISYTVFFFLWDLSA